MKRYRYKFDPRFDNDGYFAKFHLMVWGQERCVLREDREDWGAVRFLKRDFDQWASDNGTPFISNELFIAALQELGHEISRGMAKGIFLKADAWGLESSQ